MINDSMLQAVETFLRQYARPSTIEELIDVVTPCESEQDLAILAVLLRLRAEHGIYDEHGIYKE